MRIYDGIYMIFVCIYKIYMYVQAYQYGSGPATQSILAASFINEVIFFFAQS